MEPAAETTVFLLKPFFIGLYIGIFVALFIFIREKAAARKLKKEILNRKREVEELKRQNENLRISLQSFSEKPGRKEIKQLHLYQKAVEILTEKAPGFAQSWQSALRDGEEEMKLIHLGAIPFVKLLLPRTPSSRKSIENKSGK
jgi:MFS superfamily sulfate permease-like transporter